MSSKLLIPKFFPMSSNPNSHRQLSPEKTAVILQGAMQVFLENGYAGTTMDRVAIASGVSKPTIYNHFQDKETLFNCLIEQLVKEREWAEPMDMLQRPAATPESTLTNFANCFLDCSIHTPGQVNFIRLVMGESGRFPELGRAFVRHMDRPMLKALTNCFAEMGISDPDASARIFMGTLVFYLILTVMMDGKDIVPMDRDRLIKQLVNQILSSCT